MQLRATVGSYAGQIREYTYVAGRAALEAGFAEPAGEVPPSLAALVRPTTPADAAVPRVTPASATRRRHLGRH